MTADKSLLHANEHRLLGLMIFSLMAAVQPGESETIAQSFLIIHFGFFLLWQPVIKQDADFDILQLVILLAIIIGFIYVFSPWLNALWSLVLLTLLSGRIFARGIARAAYGITVITVFLELILVATPELFGLVALNSSVKQYLSPLLLALPLLLLFMPVRDFSGKQVDFIRGVSMVIMVSFLCMASALITLTTELEYLESLIGSVLIISIFMILSAFLWSSHGGFSGLAELWEKYLLNIGGPFEDWISHVSILEANSHIRPANFLSASLRYLMQQDWVCGVHWKTDNEHGLHGDESKHKVSIKDEKLELVLYCHTPVGPSLMLHCKLLLSVLTFYYRARLQELQMVKQAHMQAIYETGSKLTHDVKNILQSTQTMTQIINDDDAEQQEIIAVLKKQMPLLTQRLNTTLDKLRSPVTSDAIQNKHRGSLQHWWNQLRQRYSGRHIEFISDIEVDTDVVIDVFTTVAENLLDNARSKRIREPRLGITVELSYRDAQLRLRVTDTGTAIDNSIADQLLNEVVPSHDGFGIGLYQSNELARDHGYTLEVVENRNGEVSFLLSRSYTEHDNH